MQLLTGLLYAVCTIVQTNEIVGYLMLTRQQLAAITLPTDTQRAGVDELAAFRQVSFPLSAKAIGAHLSLTMPAADGGVYGLASPLDFDLAFYLDLTRTQIDQLSQLSVILNVQLDADWNRILALQSLMRKRQRVYS